jgi:hypothetical protein
MLLFASIAVAWAVTAAVALADKPRDDAENQRSKAEGGDAAA